MYYPITENTYSNLMKLCENEDLGFYHVDQEYNGRTYRTFSYRLVSYDVFHEYTDAMNCRGLSFDITDAIPRLVAVTPHKFFNLHEGSYDKVINYINDIEFFMRKEDGSLITSFIDGKGNVGFKSKTSFSSDMAIAALNFYHSNSDFRNTVDKLVELYPDYSINFEYVSPDNLIVVPYERTELVILNMRGRDGDYIFPPVIEQQVGSRWVVDWFVRSDNEDFVKSVFNMTTDSDGRMIEGFVMKLSNGDMKKIKTDNYVRIHHIKSSINVDANLFNVIIDEDYDDIIKMIEHDENLKKRFDDMFDFASKFYNHFVATVEDYARDNKHLERKEYVMKAKDDPNITKMMFGVVMALYDNKPFDYKAYVKKYAKEILEREYAAGNS